ncbi:MAG: hypothetical protein R2712_29125, partial [Vicinamibacterales bacterium]
MTKADLLLRLRERLAHPSTSDEIVRILRVPRLERPAIKRHLRQLVTDGLLVRVRGHLYALPRERRRTEEPARAPVSELVGRFERDRLGQAY